MNRLPVVLLFSVLAVVSSTVVMTSQTLDTARIEQVVRKAVDFMDRNLPDEAIREWNEAIRLRPGFSQYLYERAICYMMKQQYRKAIEELTPIHKDTLLFDRGYQLLGNCYDFLNDTSSARRCYREGLQVYPTSGRLHYELGNSSYLDANQAAALDWWIRGTRVEPTFASNYYQICKTFANSRYRFWALFYGELFLNFESATDRTGEISKLLFDTWNASIKPGTNDPINLASDDLLSEPSPLGPAVMNFPTAYEFTVATSLAALSKKWNLKESKALSLSQMVELRVAVVKGWHEAGYVARYPNDLLSFHDQLLSANWLSEYFHWLYSYGSINEMRSYYRSNEQRYDTFLGYHGQHGMDFTKPKCVGYKCP